MPKRDRQQLDKRNASRRKQKKLGRKGIFYMEHLQNTHQNIFTEVGELYEYLNTIYPKKHSLTKTQLYLKCIQDKAIKDKTIKYTAKCGNQTGEIRPVLRIPLIQMPPTSTITRETPQQTAVPVVETTLPQPPQLPSLADEGINRLLKDLQQDPDLRDFFQEHHSNDAVVRSLGPDFEQVIPIQKVEEEVGPETLECEIDKIIREEFEQLGTDLPDLTNVDNELLQ